MGKSDYEPGGYTSGGVPRYRRSKSHKTPYIDPVKPVVPLPEGQRNGREWVREHHEDIEAALYRSHGVLTKAAEELNCHRRDLRREIGETPALQEALEDSRESFKELAEWAIKEQVLAGQPTLQVFYAKAQMGWMEADRRNAAAPVQINLTWNDGSDKPEIQSATHEPIAEIEGGE